MKYIGENSGSRESGILMPFRALPGDHDHQGTLGDEATEFLKATKDLGFGKVHDLPFSPPDPFGSPYSSDSAFAIDPQRIDLNQVAAAKDIDLFDLDEYQKLAQSGDAGPEIREMKTELLRKAAKNFTDNGLPERKEAFLNWYQDEARWLEGFATYQILKNLPENSDWRWQNWEHGKDFSAQLVLDTKLRHEEEFQAIAYQQWVAEQQTRRYLGVAREQGIQVWGDVPFYVGGGEVWAHRSLFNLDEKGYQFSQGGADKSVTSETGQVWGFATYKVDGLRDEAQIQRLVDWWVDRLTRAYELSYGQVRLDHFIGWAEPYILKADAENGLDGIRDYGLGKYILKALVKKFGGNLPFYPEDLGTQTEKTPELRDEFELFCNTLAVRSFTKCLRNRVYPVSIHNPDNYQMGSVSFSSNHDMSPLVATFDKLRVEDPRALEDYVAYENQMNPHNPIELAMPSRRLGRHVMERIMLSESAYVFMWVGDVLQGGPEWQYNIPATVQLSNWSRRMDSNDMNTLRSQAPYWLELHKKTRRLIQDEPEIIATAAD